MCHIRQANFYYLKCEHYLPQRDERIQCANSRCVFSPTHGTACNPSTCRQTCWHRLQHPERYTPHINSLCPRCSQGSHDIRFPIMIGSPSQVNTDAVTTGPKVDSKYLKL